MIELTKFRENAYVSLNAQVSYTTICGWPGLANPRTLASSVPMRID